MTDTPAPHAAQLGPITCTPNPLPAGQTANCTAQSPYSTTSSDVEAGEIVNTATASGTVSGAPTTSNPWSVSVDVREPQPGWTAIVVNTDNQTGLTP